MNSQIREQLKIPIEKVANNNNSASQTKNSSGNGSSFGSKLQKFLQSIFVVPQQCRSRLQKRRAISMDQLDTMDMDWRMSVSSVSNSATSLKHSSETTVSPPMSPVSPMSVSSSVYSPLTSPIVSPKQQFGAGGQQKQLGQQEEESWYSDIDLDGPSIIMAARKNHTTDLLGFLTSVRAFKQLTSKACVDGWDIRQAIVQEAQRIVNRYIAQGAFEEINIDGNSRKKIMDQFHACAQTSDVEFDTQVVAGMFDCVYYRCLNDFVHNAMYDQ